LTRPALSERGLIALLAACTAVGPLALSIYMPILPLVQQSFGVSIAAVNLTVSAPLMAFAVGLLVWGPLSDHHGRRPVMLAGLGVNLCGSLSALVAPSIAWLTFARVVQALGSSAGVTIARATIGDTFAHERMARMIAYLTMVMMVANSLAPVIGGTIAGALGWRAVFVVLAGFAALVACAAWRWLPESRTARAGGTVRHAVAATFRLFGNAGFVGIAVLSGIVYAEFYAWVSLMPYVFKDSLGHTPAEYGLWYLSISGGYFAGNFYLSRAALQHGTERLLALGLAISGIAAVVGYALALAGQWQALAIFAPWSVIAFGQGLTLPVLTANAVARAPGATGSASGLLGFIQQVLSALSVQAVAGASVATPLPATGWCAALALVGWAGYWVAARRARARAAR
jgi:DHA1 family bicyclomycin/chloramphenicol resistance-like MFS transporter